MSLLKNPAVNKVLYCIIFFCVVFLTVDFFVSQEINAQNESNRIQEDQMRMQIKERDDRHMQQLMQR